MIRTQKTTRVLQSDEDKQTKKQTWMRWRWRPSISMLHDLYNVADMQVIYYLLFGEEPYLLRIKH